jgi:hypothetical protein
MVLAKLKRFNFNDVDVDVDAVGRCVAAALVEMGANAEQYGHGAPSSSKMTPRRSKTGTSLLWHDFNILIGRICDYQAIFG